jgi:hypothetical protein
MPESALPELQKLRLFRLQNISAQILPSFKLTWNMSVAWKLGMKNGTPIDRQNVSALSERESPPQL